MINSSTSAAISARRNLVRLRPLLASGEVVRHLEALLESTKRKPGNHGVMPGLGGNLRPHPTLVAPFVEYTLSERNKGRTPEHRAHPAIPHGLPQSSASSKP